MIMALAGQKGGSSKSTVSIALAAEWTAREKRVLLVDADRQQTAATWGAVAAEKGLPCPTIVVLGTNMVDELPKLSVGYDITIIDTPPRHGEIQRASLIVSHVALIPCGPATADVWSLGETLQLIDKAKAINTSLQAAIVIAKKPVGTVLGASMRQSIAGCGIPVLQSELCQRVAYAEFLGHGCGLSQYAKRSLAAGEIVKLADELESLFLSNQKEKNHHGAKAKTRHSKTSKGRQKGHQGVYPRPRRNV